jgi:hypothetical protein
MFNESMVREIRISITLKEINIPMTVVFVNLHSRTIVCLHRDKSIILFFYDRITGEPLFGNSSEGFMYSDEQLGYGGGSSSEHSPSAMQAGAVGFDFHRHPNDLGHFLSAAVGHEQILHGAVDFNPDESDDDMSEESDDDDDDDDDVQSDGDESSGGELDE